MRAGGDEDAWYAPRVALRHVRGVAARNLRVPSANGERFANRDARDGDGFARDVAHVPELFYYNFFELYSN